MGKIFKVIEHSMDEMVSSIEVKLFDNKEAAMKLFQKKVKEIKENYKEEEDYIIEEDSDSFDMYLDGYAVDDSISIYIEEDELIGEKVLVEEIELEKED